MGNTLRGASANRPAPPPGPTRTTGPTMGWVSIAIRTSVPDADHRLHQHRPGIARPGPRRCRWRRSTMSSRSCEVEGDAQLTGRCARPVAIGLDRDRAGESFSASAGEVVEATDDRHGDRGEAGGDQHGTGRLGREHRWWVPLRRRRQRCAAPASAASMARTSPSSSARPATWRTGRTGRWRGRPRRGSRRSARRRR